jgi:hypothetical protein
MCSTKSQKKSVDYVLLRGKQVFTLFYSRVTSLYRHFLSIMNIILSIHAILISHAIHYFFTADLMRQALKTYCAFVSNHFNMIFLYFIADSSYLSPNFECLQFPKQ